MSFLQKLPFHLLALFVIVCWGLTPVSTKVLYDYGMGPWAVLALRVVIAYGVLIFLSPKTIYAGTPRDEGLCVLLGIALVPVYYGLQNVALVSGDAATVAITATITPSSMVRPKVFRYREVEKISAAVAREKTPVSSVRLKISTLTRG